MSPRPKNSTREKTAEKREKILESAMDTFAEKGFDGANMRQIARGAGVNKYMLYYHFEDKKTLFEQVLDSLTK
ncbi:MAG: helix-turn-helix transcriptional regulator, partial [Candidatus Marinimicrobia bacterium]|nr:helix-turn-helix transcriptional regulator [Candidatus Neomarinimicrobiota bacterium]